MARRLTVTEWRERCSDTHDSLYGYSEWPDLVKSADRVPIECPTHGTFYQILDNHYRGKGCPMCGNQSRSTSNRKNRQYYVDKMIQTHGELYTYDGVGDDLRSDSKVRIECGIHGEFEQTVDSHIRGCGCPQCGRMQARDSMERTNGTRSGHQPIPKGILTSLQDRDWMDNQYTNIHKSSTALAADMGVDAQTVLNYIHKHSIPILPMNKVSAGEQELLDFCREYDPTAISGIRSIVPPKEIDIWMPTHNLAIEYCGLYWHSEQVGRGRTYHKDKYDACLAQGIQLLTIFEDEWQQRKEQVQSKILSLIGEDARPVVYARNVTIVEIDTHTKRDFLNLHHIQGNGPSSINLGLYWGDELVGCCGFIKTRTCYYLNRYATSHRVVGGFSKAVTHFCRNYEWDQLVSFADCRWSRGTLYERSGWTLEGSIPPDYYYVLPGGDRRMHKFNFRHKQLSTILENYNPDLSERENCDMNGLLRVWDCGKHRFILENKNKNEMHNIDRK